MRLTLLFLSLWLLFAGSTVGLAQNPQLRILLAKGRAYFGLGMHEEAIREYKEAIRVEPWNSDAHLLLGLAYYCRGSFQLAAEELAMGRNLSGRSVGELMPLPILEALFFQKAGKLEHAQKLLESYSEFRGSIRKHAMYLLGHSQEGEFLEKAPGGQALANLAHGISSVQKGEAEKAENSLRLVTNSVHRGSWVYVVAKQELERMGRWRERVRLAQPVLEQELRTVDVGKPEELRDVHRVYVTADSEDRDNIIANLAKYDGITVLDKLEGEKPHVILSFQSVTLSHAGYQPGFSIPTKSGSIYVPGGSYTASVETGRGIASRVTDGNTIRVLWRFKDQRSTRLERRPSTNFARDFTKLLRKLRKER